MQFDSSNFNAIDMDEKLGAIYSKDKTVFKVWSPDAEKVNLKIYSSGTGGNLIDMFPMERQPNGIWIKEILKDMDGKYYTYEVTVNGSTNETQDVYSKAVGVNGNRSMVVDFSKTNPEGWLSDKGPYVENQTDAVICEISIRDMSMDKNSGIKMKGKYLGLAETGTQSIEGESTGIDHLKELGITHVQIMPFFDFATIDESKPESSYNWGYDPKNFMAPEGSYSTDPYDGYVRIKELKLMIKALHDAGIGVIMDSVYNHTYDYINSPFSKTVPGYYYRKNADGSMKNCSGCLNDTASEKYMFRKYIIDSVCFYAKEYHIDGFRFDLMGLHDTDTMNDIRNELDKINPHILMYGEGWQFINTGIPREKEAMKYNIHSMNSRIGTFSDDMRDGIKGSVFISGCGGFVNYTGSWIKGDGYPYTMSELKELIKSCIVASTEHDGINYNNVRYSSGRWAAEPTQTVNFESCHDNNTLRDKIVLTKPQASEDDVLKMVKLSAFIVLTSQGIPFINSGEEMMRTKPGSNGKRFEDNSFVSPDSVNCIKWSDKHKYKNLVNYYEGLIKIRRAHPAFRMAKTIDVQSNLKFMDSNDSTIAYTISNNANGDSWNKIVVAINAGKEYFRLNLPHSNFAVYANENTADNKAICLIDKNFADIPPMSAYILAV